jgi:hypothetical protein
MRLAMGTALLATVAFSGCRTSPLNLVRHHPPEATGTAELSATPPELAASQPVSSTPRPVPNVQSLPSPTVDPKKPVVENVEPHPSPAAAPTSSLDFPTAKRVEGKPGYVYSPFEDGKYVDVSGYAAGSKVKDPYSGKIFLVP